MDRTFVLTFRDDLPSVLLPLTREMPMRGADAMHMPIRGQRELPAFADETGATAVEYAIMVALVAAVIIAAVMILGKDVKSLFERVAEVWPQSTQ